MSGAEAPKQDIGVRLDDITTRLKEAREANDAIRIDTELTNLSEALNEVKGKTAKERVLLDAKMKLASAQVDLLVAQNNERAKQIKAVIDGIHADLDTLKSQVSAGTDGAETDPYAKVPAWLKVGMAGMGTGLHTTAEKIKQAADVVSPSLRYIWDTAIVGPFSAVAGALGIKNMKKIPFPPVGRMIKKAFFGFTSSFAPEWSAERMKEITEQEAFERIVAQVESDIESENDARKKKAEENGTEPKLITSVVGDQFNIFKQLTTEERAGISRKVLTDIRNGKTEISLETFLEEETEEEETEEKKEDTPKQTAEGLPSTPISFDTLKNGIDVASFGKVQVSASPARITVGGRTWEIRGTGFASLASFTIGKGEWTGEKLMVTISGKLPFVAPTTESAEMKKDDALALLKHLAKNNDPFQIKRTDGSDAPAQFVLI